MEFRSTKGTVPRNKKKKDKKYQNLSMQSNQDINPKGSNRHAESWYKHCAKTIGFRMEAQVREFP